jgi:hypothetical protein
MVTNISFEAWADYLGDAPLAMAILDGCNPILRSEFPVFSRRA